MAATDLDVDGKADVVVSFKGHGLWIYQNDATWIPLHPLEARRLEAGRLDKDPRADLVIDFGTGVGLWTYRNSTTWVPLHSSPALGFTLGDFDGNGCDEIVIGFGSAGLWRYAGGHWTLLHPMGPGGLGAGRLH